MNGQTLLDLRGRRALVGGSTRGIGRASAEALAGCGASVTLLARDAALLESARAALAAPAGQKHHALVADFERPGAVAAAVAAHVADAGPIEILVNNTGGPAGGPIVDAGAGEFERAFAMHVVCNQLLVQALLPGMIQRGYGRIINVISTSVKQPIPGLGVSNTIRAAVANWAKTLAGEVAASGVTVNNVLPGYTDTERLGQLIDATARRTGRPADEVKRGMIASIPLGRFARPDEIAAAVAFLASPAASYVTGINLPVDGGRLSTL
ncbi:MAG: 3-oxoacyl-[acyl-carrier-protein] reductase FabG [Phycisphaerae bacterium]|nr:3-oxoacyl-[acyl-carrier-protein] reductase FabG [Phycisphaerae bacterium]